VRVAFAHAVERAPAIIVIDHVDLIVQVRLHALPPLCTTNGLTMDTNGWRVCTRPRKNCGDSVAMQLAHEMDRLSARHANVVVLATADALSAVHPTLLRAGRLDDDVAFERPNRDGRLEILRMHTRTVVLAADVDLHRLAWATEGFTGADLARLRRAALDCGLARHLRDRVDVESSVLPTITTADFDVRGA